MFCGILVPFGMHVFEGDSMMWKEGENGEKKKRQKGKEKF